MAEIVNLRQARKRMTRAADERRAADNRAAFGTPKRERERLDTERERAERRLDGLRLEPDAPPKSG